MCSETNTNTKTVPGLKYYPEYLTKDEEKELLKLIHDSKELTSITHSTDSRKVIQYGYTYSYDRSGVTKCDPIPDIYKKLIETERVKKVIGTEFAFDQLIINQYLPGQGISPHIDHTKYFGEIVFCISIGADTLVEFTQKKNEFTKGDDTQYIAPRSAYAMTGDLRYKWYHAISGSKRTAGRNMGDPAYEGVRYSLTFRKVIVPST